MATVILKEDTASVSGRSSVIRTVGFHEPKDKYETEVS